MGDAKGKGKTDPKEEKKALTQISGCFGTFEKRMQTRLKLLEDMRLKCELCESGKLDPSTLKFDPMQSLKDLEMQFYKDLASDEKQLNMKLKALQKIDLKNTSPQFNDQLGKIIKKTTTVKVGKTEFGLDPKAYLKHIEKGMQKGKVDFKFVPVKLKVEF
ncbi:MAG: hypothetical protein AAFR79_10140 [Pseudomonadota bacterium]